MFASSFLHPLVLQNGMLGGYYVIRNVRKPLPGSSRLALFERHKSVNVEYVILDRCVLMIVSETHLRVLHRIESESSDPTFDSRRIVKLAIVATDVPVSSSHHPQF